MGVLRTRLLLFGVYIMGLSDFWKLPKQLWGWKAGAHTLWKTSTRLLSKPWLKKYMPFGLNGNLGSKAQYKGDTRKHGM